MDPTLVKDKKELERVQLYATRLYFNDWTINLDDAQLRSGWPSLEDRRKRLKLAQFYKYLNGMHHYENCNNFDKIVDHRRFSRHVKPHQLILPEGNISYEQCFEFSSIVLYNNLNSDIALGDFNKFHNVIKDMRF